MFMIYLYIKFHMASSNDSLIIVIKLRTKRWLHAATVLLLYVLQKNYIYKVAHFFTTLKTYMKWR
jgi:hypothetical protein